MSVEPSPKPHGYTPSELVQAVRRRLRLASTVAGIVLGVWMGVKEKMVLAMLNAGVAGIMIALCIGELMPAAVEGSSAKVRRSAPPPFAPPPPPHTHNHNHNHTHTLTHTRAHAPNTRRRCSLATWLARRSCSFRCTP